MSEAKAVLARVAETLQTAEFGLRMLRSNDPTVRRTGLRNLVVFGRAVTNTLQGLRSISPDFNPWYQPWVERMRTDQVMSYFYKLRSEILKQGKMNTGVSVHIQNLNLGTLMAVVPKPPNAKSFFIGDSLGGSGWEVVLPSGETQKFYVQIPQGVAGVELTVNLHLVDAPAELKDIPARELGEHYFGQLATMCKEAEQRFNGS